MDKESKKKRIGQTVAFYAALAVCLIAVGVGTWELFQPNAGPGTAAVSSPMTLPETYGPPSPETMEPEAAEAAEAASGSASVEKDSGASASDSGKTTDSKSASDSGKTTDSKSASDSGKTTGGKSASDSGKTTGGKSQSDSGKTTGGKSQLDSGKTTGGKSQSDSGKTTGGKSQSDSGKTTGGKSQSDSGKTTGGKSASDSGKQPVEGVVVTSYSMDQLIYNETMRDWRTHDGVDIAADAGTAVVAARAGTVESVAADPIMGMTVVVRHDDGWGSVYASLSDAVEVEAGDEVTAGQVLGFTGETAASEAALGPHLHFSVLRDGKPVDPETFLP